VSAWQDVDVSKPVDVRVIEDVETMRALADPTRVAILRVLMSGDRSDPPVMSAKEIAATLQDSQIKHLTAAGLIQIAETRMVSGIQEQRYRTGQLGLRIGGDLLTDAPALTSTLVALLDDFRGSLSADLAAGRVVPGQEDPLGMILSGGRAVRVAPQRAAEFRSRLRALLADFDDLDGTDQEGVTAHFLIGWYTIRTSSTEPLHSSEGG
jgi:DNA-binding transcriptional ArsR family regulator